MKKYFYKIEFCPIDSNDEWVSNCGSAFCSYDHNIRMNVVKVYPGDMDMTYLDFQDVFECHLRERKNSCNFVSL